MTPGDAPNPHFGDPKIWLREKYDLDYFLDAKLTPNGAF